MMKMRKIDEAAATSLREAYYRRDSEHNPNGSWDEYESFGSAVVETMRDEYGITTKIVAVPKGGMVIKYEKTSSGWGCSSISEMIYSNLKDQEYIIAGVLVGIELLYKAAYSDAHGGGGHLHNGLEDLAHKGFKMIEEIIRR